MRRMLHLSSILTFALGMGSFFLPGCTQRSASGSQSAPSLEAAARAALSEIHGTKQLPGLEKPVTVLRDAWGVPHIYAQNQHDLFFAQGFVTAQDRLFQMELWKRVGQGRLAEVLGSAYLERDINARRLAYRGSMDTEFASYGPDTRQILEAFTQGINTEIALRLAPGGPGLPVEFKLAGFAPERWKPEDCLSRMAGFPMTRNSLSELAHAKLVTLLGVQKASALFDLDPPILLDSFSGEDLSGLSPQLLRNMQGSDATLTFPADSASALASTEEPGSGKHASNNWVISGRLTASGRPFLANDPHRTINKSPSLRYLVHLVAPGWDVIGATEPAVPGIQNGHNQRIGWGWTIFGIDQQDLYIETLDGYNPLRYKTDIGWQQMEVQKSVFRVKGQPDVTVDLKFTRHGPVLWEDAATHRAVALRWVGSEPGAAGYLGGLALDRASNWNEFEEAVKRWKLPTENIVYADIDGNIGEHSVGLAPLRKNFTGTMPVPGVGGYEWNGWISVSELPHQFNPQEGFVVTANHRMTPDKYPYKLGFEWAEPYRADRIKEILRETIAAGHKFTREDMQNLQADIVSIPAREFQRLLLAATPASDDASAQMLLRWDCKLDRDSPAAALFEFWAMEVEKQVTHRLAPESAWGELEGHVPLTIILDKLKNPPPAVFGGDALVSGSDALVERNKLLLESLKSAAEQLRRFQGSDSSQWNWGRLHTATFHHPLELVGKAGALFNVGPVPRPGDSYTVNNAAYSGGKFDQRSGPSYREILDVGNWDESVTVNTPGQSGQPGSPHYSDLEPIWDRGGYFPMLYSQDAVNKQVKDRLVLEPTTKH